MVSYTEWTRIGHDVYQQLGGGYPDEQTATNVTQTLAAFWQENKSQLIGLGESEARRVARNNMSL